MQTAVRPRGAAWRVARWALLVRTCTLAVVARDGANSGRMEARRHLADGAQHRDEFGRRRWEHSGGGGRTEGPAERLAATTVRAGQCGQNKRTIKKHTAKKYKWSSADHKSNT